MVLAARLVFAVARAERLRASRAVALVHVRAGSNAFQRVVLMMCAALFAAPRPVLRFGYPHVLVGQH